VDLERERSVTTVAQNVTPSLDNLDRVPGQAPPIVLGRTVAERLHAGVGDEVVLASPFDATATPFGLYPKFRKYRVAGIFSSGLYEYDSSLAFISLEEAMAFYRMGSAATGIEVRIRDVFEAEAMKERVLDALGRYPYRINTWIELNENLFLWMKLEKAGMGVILLLIVLIAAFNIVGVLVMVVMENKREIGILKSMGASDGSIMSVFMAAGTEIGAVGVLLGTILGLAGAWTLDRYPLNLPGDVYFLNSLPVLLEWGDVVMVVAVVFALCALATLYPSWKAARLDPVQAIREL
jgi:lipoprotein-releasing system permease protein